ncbi:amidase signature domain-containing protein [Aspergillus stella-maris]|uniref:amidase signature domain-containing protein n=1 Tax=Aspergillus stella-maris TaxID=1810926 RepID=UPI003CCD2A2B
MSTLALPADFKSPVSAEDLKNCAAKYDIKIKPGAEEDAYLLLLQSAEALHRTLDQSPDYIHPGLEPTPTTEPRKFFKAPEAENPLNGWSHGCDLTAEKPTNSLLAGRTFVVKDNVSVAGLPTTLGLPAWFQSRSREYVPSSIDATIVKRLLEAGATLKGTSVCESYSAAPMSITSASGCVHNPWARAHTCGGSSSGSGALMGQKAVAEAGIPIDDGARTVDLAVGGDQGGSIRLPAAYNGIYGLKPTHGLIPYTGVLSIVPMIDHVGPMATKLEDIAAMLQVMAGYDGIDPRMTPESPMPSQVKDYPGILNEFAKEAKGKKGTMKVGLLKEAFDFPMLSDEVRDTVRRNAMEYFAAAGAEVVEVSVPMHREGPAVWTVAARTAISDYGLAVKPPGYLTYQPDHVDLQWPPTQEMFNALTAINPTIMNLVFSTDYVREVFGTNIEFKAHRKVFELRAAYNAIFKDIDVLITPTVPTVAFPFPESTKGGTESGEIMERVKAAVGLSYNTCAFNVTGHPAMSVPCGFGEAATEGVGKLPIGMQVIGRRWEDDMVLKAAALFEMGKTEQSVALANLSVS